MERARSQGWRRHLSVGALLALAVALTFGEALRQPLMVSDDWFFSLKVQGWGGLLEPHSYHFSPVFYAAWKGLYALGGGQPWPFHAANLALHAGNAWLLYGLIVRAGRGRAALLVAALYALWPLHYEALFWATGLHYSLTIALGLACVHAYLSLLARGGGAKMLLAGALALPCLFSMETGAALLVACPLWDLFRLSPVAGEQRSLRSHLGRCLVRALPLAGAVACLLIAKALVESPTTIQADVTLGQSASASVDFLARVALPPESLLLAIHPHSQAPLWGALEERPLLTAGLLFLISIPCLLALSKRGTPLLRFALVWLLTAVVLFSYGAGTVCARYFSLVALPGALAWICTVELLIPLERRGRQVVVSLLVAGLVAGGVAANRDRGRDQLRASQLAQDLLESPALVAALRDPRPLLVLDLPDRDPRLRPGLGLAYVYRNGFAAAVALRYQRSAEEIQEGRTPELGFAQNVWHLKRPFSEAELIRAQETFVVLRYSHESQRLLRVTTKAGQPPK